MKPPEPPIEEIAAVALNDQGYLLQQKISGVARSPDADGQYPHNWYIEAEEVPVSLAHGEETRVDLVLRHKKRGIWRAVLETKRLSREYKRWIFFGQTERHPGPSSRKYYVEYADFVGGGNWHHGSESEPPMHHAVKDHAAWAECEVFDYGIEARIKGSDEAASTKTKASATNTIEDALRQVTLGQAGLALHLRRTRDLQFRLVPIIVTTADLFAARFAHENVSLETGKIDPKDLKLEQREWLAINHRVSDLICQQSRFTTNLTSDIAAHLVGRQVRTVFIVRSTAIQDFLSWLGTRTEDWN